jgi:hypothetical protein
MHRNLIRLLVPAVFLFPIDARGQAEAPAPLARQAVFLELGGAAGVASLNYDRLLSDAWAIRAGLEVDGSGAHYSDWYPEVPVTLSYLALGGHHKLDVGGGTVFTMFAPRTRFNIDYTLHLGYRYQPAPSGLFFRATLERREYAIRPGLPTWAGIGFGYGF